MDLINYEDLTDLLEQYPGVHASLFMPLEWEPENLQANSIRLKNLIKQGQQRLGDKKFWSPRFPIPDGEDFFQPAQDFLQNGRFVNKNSRGLAMFLADGVNYLYYLPQELPELVVLGPRFHITPLLPLLTSNGRFYLLTLSQNQVQLWQGDQSNLELVDVPNMPADMDEALALEDPERSLQLHTSGEQTTGRTAIFHGHDADKEKKGAILRYCRTVNEAVQQHLANEDAPLLLASVDYLQPIYQKANTYAHLLVEGVSGNPKILNAQELHAKAWQIVQPHTEQAQKDALAQYEQGAATEKTSQALVEIVPAAAYGRVATLFVAIGAQRGGRFDSTSGEVELCQAEVYDCEDLLNLAVTTTLSQGGAVYAIPPEAMPDEAQIAAIFRYAV